MITAPTTVDSRRLILASRVNALIGQRKDIAELQVETANALAKWIWHNRIEKKVIADKLNISPKVLSLILNHKKQLTDAQLLRILGILEGNEA